MKTFKKILMIYTANVLSLATVRGIEILICTKTDWLS